MDVAGLGRRFDRHPVPGALGPCGGWLSAFRSFRRVALAGASLSSWPGPDGGQARVVAARRPVECAGSDQFELSIDRHAGLFLPVVVVRPAGAAGAAPTLVHWRPAARARFSGYPAGPPAPIPVPAYGGAPRSGAGLAYTSSCLVGWPGHRTSDIVDRGSGLVFDSTGLFVTPAA